LFGEEPQQLVAIADDGRLLCVPETLQLIKQIGKPPYAQPPVHARTADIDS
jgi:hypothetical protein